MFVRVKTIAGKKYGYLVENTWKKGKTKQKVKKYLGPIYAPEKLQNVPFAEWKGVELESYISSTPLKRVLRNIVQHTLWQHGFLGKQPQREGITVNLMKGTVTKRKDAVIAMHEGFLCKETFKTLLQIKPVEEETRGQHLAELLVKTGLQVEKAVFVHLYRKIYNI